MSNWLIDEIKRQEAIYLAILQGADIPLPKPIPIIEDYDEESDYYGDGGW